MSEHLENKKYKSLGDNPNIDDVFNDNDTIWIYCL